MTCGHATRCATCTCGDAPDTTGADLRDAALDIHEHRHFAILRNARRTFLRGLLDSPTGVLTFDAVRPLLALPDDVDPVIYGAVPRPLKTAGIIAGCGHTLSRRHERHSAPVTVWRLVSRTLALRWLEQHKPIPLPTPEPGPVQADLFDDMEKPGADTPGNN